MRFGEITLCSLSLSIPNQPSNQPKPGVQHCLPEINQSQEGLSSDFCYVIFSHLKSELKKKNHDGDVYWSRLAKVNCPSLFLAGELK